MHPGTLLASLWARHRLIMCVLGLAAALRVLVIVAYRPAFWFPDSTGYLATAKTLVPSVNQGFGYSVFLAVFHPGNLTLAVVSLVQHLLTLALAALCYAFLQRRGCPQWLAALAVVPIVFDSTRLTLEHYIMSDTLFVTLLTTGLLALLWTDRPTVASVAVAGGLMGLAGATRLVVLPVVVILLLVLLVRRVGWRVMTAFALAFATPLLTYAVWYHHHHGVFATSQFQGSFLYGRVASFADCRGMEIRPELRRMCPHAPVGWRLYADYYFWGPGAPRYYRPDPPSDDLIHEFSVEAIKQQPADYLRVVGEDLWHFVDPRWTPDVRVACYAHRYLLPVDSVQRESPNWGCQTLLASSTHRSFVRNPDRGADWLTHSLNWYSRHTVIPRPLLALGVMLFLSALVNIRTRVGREALVIGLCGLSTVVLATASVMHEPRYLMPALIPIWLSAALAVHAFRERSRERGATAHRADPSGSTRCGDDRCYCSGQTHACTQRQPSSRRSYVST